MAQQIEEYCGYLKDQYIAFQGAFESLRLSRYDLLKLTWRKFLHDLALWLGDAQQYWVSLSPRSQLALLVLAISMIALLLEKAYASSTSLRRRGIPVLKLSSGVNRWDYDAILQDGARRYPDSPYIINYSGYEYVIYPSKCFDEVKRLPESVASSIEWFTHVITQGWRLLGTHSDELHKTFAGDLARAVPIRTRERQKNASAAFENALGPCKDWKRFSLYWTIQEIVAATNATGLVGDELGSDGRWLKAVQGFPISIMVGVYGVHSMPRFLRPVVSLIAFLPARLLELYMKYLLYPVVKRDLVEYETATQEHREEKLLRATHDKKLPIAAWLLHRYRTQKSNLQRLLHDFIVVAFMSTGTSAGALFYMIAELVTRPELIEELREEISTILVDGGLPQTHLEELQKLDSFMCESARMFPISHLVLNRRLQKNVKLSVGPELPAGSLLCVDAYNITRSKEIWENPDVFDPMRFIKLRQSSGSKSQHQFTSLGRDSPGWGDGSQACPGRVFAANTLKIILVELLMNYDMQLPPGSSKVKRASMPNGTFAPDLKFEIMVKKRG